MSLPLRAKLACFGALGLAVSVVVALVACHGLGALASSLDEVQSSGAALRNHMEADMLHDAIRADVLVSLLAKGPTERQAALSDLKQHSAKLRASLQANASLGLAAPIVLALNDAQKALEAYIAAAEKTTAADPRSGAEALPGFLQEFSVLETQMEQISEWIEESARRASAVAEAARHNSVLVMKWAIGAALVVLALSTVLLLRLITRPIHVLIAGMSEIQASKDLTRRIVVTANDEIGRVGVSFNDMVETLNRIISEVNAGSARIDDGVRHIAAASQSLAQGASEQASSLQQISASLEELSGQTQQSAESTRQASALAEESQKSAGRGQLEMTQMHKAVNEIKQSSSEISKIIKVIDEIAFQTNLLALNAAVEAARAGEAGKGFAVVAEEVRNLARRSAEAAKNTAAMIEDSVRRSENGVQIASRVGHALEEIAAGTQKVNTLLCEIAAACTEEAAGIGQINQGVSQLDQVTQQNAGNSEELAASAEELSSQVTSLNGLVALFTVNGGGRVAASRSAPSASKPKPPAALPSRRLPAKGAASSGAGPAAAAGRSFSTRSAERQIPMEDDEILSSF